MRYEATALLLLVLKHDLLSELFPKLIFLSKSGLIPANSLKLFFVYLTLNNGSGSCYCSYQLGYLMILGFL